jgi:hypothetical protein
MWRNIVQQGRPQMAIWRMRIACWIPKATDTHSEYVTFIAFPLHQWLHERVSILRYTNSAFSCLLLAPTDERVIKFISIHCPAVTLSPVSTTELVYVARVVLY